MTDDLKDHPFWDAPGSQENQYGTVHQQNIANKKLTKRLRERARHRWWPAIEVAKRSFGARPPTDAALNKALVRMFRAAKHGLFSHEGGRIQILMVIHGMEPMRLTMPFIEQWSGHDADPDPDVDPDASTMMSYAWMPDWAVSKALKFLTAPLPEPDQPPEAETTTNYVGVRRGPKPTKSEAAFNTILAEAESGEIEIDTVSADYLAARYGNLAGRSVISVALTRVRQLKRTS